MSKYKSVDLSAYKAITVENVSFINAELDNLENACIRASDILSCISAGFNTAFNDRIPYKNTPVLIEIVGASGVQKTAGLPAIPYAGITMAGISWGISGSLARTRAQEASLETKIETERMAGVLSGLRAVSRRIDEGESLLYALSGKLRKSVETLKTFASAEGEISREAAKELDICVRLVKSLKQVIEADICNADGFLTKKSGVIFRKIEQEVKDV